MDSAQPIVMANCPLCGTSADSANPVASYPELTWVRCPRCSLIYKRSETPDAAAAGFYEGGYFGTGDQGRRYTQRRARRIQKSRNQILDVLNHAAPGALLDIGCSMGYTLEAARSLGLPATGADISDFAIRTCRELGFRAEKGVLGQMPFRDGEFGIVTMKHVLEHTPDPRSALRDVRRILVPGGALFIAVPHGGNRKVRTQPQTYQYFVPSRHGREHFVYYTPETMGRLLTEEGFAVRRVNPALVHRRAPPLRRLAETAAAPFRAIGQALTDAAQARKEFWVVAAKTADEASRPAP